MKLIKCLLLNDPGSDLGALLEQCAEVTRMTFEAALEEDLTGYDAFCVFGEGRALDPRLRVRLEAECEKPGKRLFAEAVKSFGPVYCAPPADTTTCRLAAALPEAEGGVPGLAPGTLLDDNSNTFFMPYQNVPGMRRLLVYKDHIAAHRQCGGEQLEELLRTGAPGLWTIGENVIMCAFRLHNFRRARFTPTHAWEKLIAFLVCRLTGKTPRVFPAPPVRFGVQADLTDEAEFERLRKAAIEKGMRWLSRLLVDGGKGGIKEGLRHNIRPDGTQEAADTVRTDCSGEAAGAFRFYGALYGSKEALRISNELYDFVFGPMTVRGGRFDGMLRWTEEGWDVCYQDDAARALLPALYACLFLRDGARFPAVCRALDFLVKTTARDGCRVARTDAPFLDDAGLHALAAAENGLPSAHYNAYYHAALLLAYLYGGNETYLDTARRGLETLMSQYPDTRREHSETQEFCRLILPLAALYRATGEEKHRAMLYRVADDLERFRYPGGGYREWDTGYQAACARTASGECSLLTENGDPVADLLYSVNWLPVGFAFAYHATGDRRFAASWREIASFFLRAQVHSADEKTDGSWCRAFDLELGAACGCPHDAGWGPLCSESGWTDAEILMGLMMMEVMKKDKR